MRSYVRGAIFLAIGACVLLVAWLTYQAYDVYTGLHGMIDVKAPLYQGEKAQRIPPIDRSHRINILVLGSDNDRKKEEARPDTQSMIVVSINPRSRRVDMLSIPRDFWVNIPGHGMGKIDLAYHYGGVSLARYTVEKYFHISIRNYAWVGLDGFIKVIDTFNGVTLNVSHPILDDYYPNDLQASDPYAYKRVFIPAGWQYMHGPEALEYVRSRHGDRIGDFGRSARQQQVLQQLRRHVNTLDILKNLRPLVDDLRGKVQTDLGLTELYQLAQLSREIPPQNIRQTVLSVPTYSSYGQASNREFGLQYVVFPKWKKIYATVARIFTPVGAPPVPVHRVQPKPQRNTPKGSATEVAVVATPSRATAVPRAITSPTPRPTATPASVSRLPGSLMYVKGGDIHRLSPSLSDSQMTSNANGLVRYSMLSVSPNRKWLAYIKFTEFASDLWVRNLHSGKSYKLTSDTDPHDIHNNLWAAWPSWSSDGKSLLMSWDIQKRNLPESEARPVDLAIWRLASTGHPIAQVTTPQIGAGGDTEIATRPGSQQYAYVRWDYNTVNNSPYSQLVVSDPAVPGSRYFLTPRGGRVLDPAWDPAGKRMAFVRLLKNGVDQITVAPVLHTKHGPVLGRRIAIDSGQVGQPAFSPDGKWVSYVKADGSGFNLYLERARGGTPMRIDAAGSGIDATTRPAWTK